MTDHTPTSNQRTLLDVIGNIPSEWRVDVTYPTLPQVAHSFDLLPELVLTNDTGEVTEEVAVRASSAGWCPYDLVDPKGRQRKLLLNGLPI